MKTKFFKSLDESWELSSSFESRKRIFFRPRRLSSHFANILRAVCDFFVDFISLLSHEFHFSLTSRRTRKFSSQHQLFFNSGEKLSLNFQGSQSNKILQVGEFIARIGSPIVPAAAPLPAWILGNKQKQSRIARISSKIKTFFGVWLKLSLRPPPFSATENESRKTVTKNSLRRLYIHGALLTTRGEKAQEKKTEIFKDKRMSSNATI